MRVSELKDLICTDVCLCKDTGLVNLEYLYTGPLKDAPVRLLGMFVGNMCVGLNDQINILVY